MSLCLLILLAACGNEIGDECSFSSDCSPQGDRVCDISSPGGYCTVLGCDFDTCPDESVCVRFFSVSTVNLSCDPATEDDTTDDCTADEICTLTRSCVPRNAEIRYCMKKCDVDDDCRSQYECRTQELMEDHGGEPVLAPGETPGEDLQPFCAPNPSNI
jgi:hypothetical protein